MLLKSKISEHQISLDPMLNEKYYRAKLGRFTSSEIHFLMGEKGIGQTGLNYIYRKVGETMLNLDSDDYDLRKKINDYLKYKRDVSTIATEHGLDWELQGLVEFGKVMTAKGIYKDNTEVKCQKLVLDGEYFGGTPDGIVVLNETVNDNGEEECEVNNAEVKCPISFDAYIRLFKCKTPEDIKKEEAKYYWQVLDQIELCGCFDGFLIIFHPFFKSGQLNIIKFNKVSIVKETGVDRYGKAKDNDFRLLNTRKKQAIEIYNQTLKELTNG